MGQTSKVTLVGVCRRCLSSSVVCSAAGRWAGRARGRSAGAGPAAGRVGGPAADTARRASTVPFR